MSMWSEKLKVALQLYKVDTDGVGTMNLLFFFYFVIVVLQIFISRDGGNKNFASVLAPGQHEGLG